MRLAAAKGATFPAAGAPRERASGVPAGSDGGLRPRSARARGGGGGEAGRGTREHGARGRGRATQRARRYQYDPQTPISRRFERPLGIGVLEEPGIYLRVAVPCPEVLLVVWPIGNVVGLRPTKPFKMSRWAAKALRSFLFSSADCRRAECQLEIICWRLLTWRLTVRFRVFLQYSLLLVRIRLAHPSRCRKSQPKATRSSS